MRKRILLILLCCAGIFALSAGAAVWWASGYTRSPEFRAEIERLLSEATGREARLEGQLSISVFPWIGLRAGGVRIGNDPAFGSTPLLTAESVSAHVKVLPLLHKRLVFDTLELHRAAVVMTIAEDGRGNWEGLAEHLRAQENATERADQFFRKITVRGIRLVDSSYRLDDREHNHSYILTGIDLRTGRIEAGKPLPFHVVTDFYWPRPELTAHLEGTGKLHWSKADPAPLLTETQVEGTVGGTFMPKSAPTAGISTTLSVEREGKDLKLSDVRLKIIGADVAGEITFIDVTERFLLDAKLKLGRFSPRSVINAYWPGTISHEHQGALVSAEGPLNISANVDELVFESPGLAVDASHLRGRVRMGFDKGTGLDFDLAADKLDSDALVEAFTSGTSSPLVVADLPMRYLNAVHGEGRIAAENLKIAGVTGQGAVVSWKAGGGVHKTQLAPFKAQGGKISADFAVSFAGGTPGMRPTGDMPLPVVLGWSGQLKMDDVDARQVTWLNKGGVAPSGPMDLRVRAEVKPAAMPANLRLGLLFRKAAGDFSGNITPAALDITPDGGQKAQARHMQFSTIAAQGRFVPVPAPAGADWAVQLDAGLTASGTKPALSLDTKFSGLARSQQGKVAVTGGQLSGRLKGWFLPKRENEATFSAKGSLDFSTQSLNLAQTSVQACGLSVAGPISGSKVLGQNFTLTGRVRCPEGDPKRLLAALEVRVPKTADKRALTRMSGEADLTLTAKGFSLTNISGQFDDLPLRGSYAVQSFDAPRQSFSLSGGNFDLDRYLPPPEVVKHGVKPERPTPEALPVDALRELNLDGNIALRSFKYKGLTTRDFKTTIAAHGGSLLMKPMGGNFYGGTISGEFSAQVVPGGMQTRLALAAKDYQAGAFMLGWAGKEVVTGRADLFLDLTGAGATDQDIMRTLEGMGSFKIVDGAYYTTSSAQESQEHPAQTPSRRSGAGLNEAQAQPAKRSGSSFSKVSAKVRAKGGVFTSDDFRLDGQNMVVTGKGSFCPAEDTINVRLTANMPGMPDVPMHVFGRLKDPEMEISTGAFIGNTIRSILGLPLKPIKFFKDLLF